MNIREFIIKLQNLTDQQKKAIIIAIVLILSFIFGFFWIRSATERLNKIGEVTKDIKLPEVELPNIELPNNQIQNTETADWKTYRNEEYGFEIKYPNYFENDRNLPSEYASSEAWFLGRQNGCQLTIRAINAEEKKISFADYGIDYDNKKYSCIGSCIGEILKLPALDGEKSVTFISTSKTLEIADVYLQTLIKKDLKIMIEISVHSGYASRQDVIDLNQKMLSTFKFINK